MKRTIFSIYFQHASLESMYIILWYMTGDWLSFIIIKLLNCGNTMRCASLASFLFLFVSPVVKAQESSIVISSEKCDTATVDQYLTSARRTREVNDDSSFYYADKALALSYRCNFSDRIIKSLTELAGWQFGHNSNRSIEYANKAIQEFEKRNLDPTKTQIIFKAYNIIAKAYEIKGMIDSSAYYYYLLNDIIERGEITDPQYAVSIYSQLALFWLNSNWDINNGNIEPTRLFIEKEKQAEARLKDSSIESFTSFMLQGAYYFMVGSYDSSRYYYTEFLKRKQAIGKSNVTWEAATFLNISETYLAENKAKEAIEYIDKTLALKDKLAGNPRYLTLANLYLTKAYFLQKNHAGCVQVFETAVTSIDKNGFLGKEVIEAYKIAGNAYKALGMLDKSIQYKDTYIVLHDSLMKQDKLDIMNRLQMKFRVADKDKALAEQKLELTESENNVRKKNFWIGGISTATVLILVIFSLWQRNARQRQKLQKKEIDSFEQKMQIANLNATIEGVEKERTRIARELHDGIGGLLAAAKINFETVKANYHLHNKTDYIEGLNLLTEASGELRKTAHNMMPEILLQEGLVEAVGYFCHTIARNSPTKIHFQTSGTIKKFHPTFELSVYRVVQELVHNILKHAKATEAVIQMGFSDTIFDLSIEDNGVGIPENILAKTKGIGLKSIEDRIKSINGSMHIRNLKGGGTGIYLEVSLKEENIVPT